MNLSYLAIDIFADGADFDTIIRLAKNPLIKGFTTNPTLMRKEGVIDYEKFARGLIEAVPDKSFSFEVLSDEFRETEREARAIAKWGDNVYVKIPITDTQGVDSSPLIRTLSADGIHVNVTAVFTPHQICRAAWALEERAPSYVSIFSGRIADTGRCPMEIVRYAVHRVHFQEQVEVIWASTRELLNISQAEEAGCHIITVGPDLLSKLQDWGADLGQRSLDTVRQFSRDAKASGLSIR